MDGPFWSQKPVILQRMIYFPANLCKVQVLISNEEREFRNLDLFPVIVFASFFFFCLG